MVTGYSILVTADVAFVVSSERSLLLFVSNRSPTLGAVRV